MDPATKTKVAVCSLHFRDGLPTAEHPLPSELLGEKGGPTEEGGDGTFRGNK